MNSRRRDFLALSSAIAAAGLTAGCLGRTTPPTNTDEKTTTMPPNVPNDMRKRFVYGNTAFALDLLRHQTTESPGENQFFSPYSISVALAMTYAGARGETRTQMRETLHFTDEERELHPGVRDLRARFAELEPTEPSESTEATESVETTEENDEGIPFQLTDANALWGQADVPYRDAFLQTLETNYGAGLREVDFRTNHEEARRTINRWVADQTREKITDLLPEGSLSHLTRLVLTNAIYFKANWEETFNEDATEQEPFTTFDGTTAEVPMMSQSDTFPYAEVDGHQLIELPYVGGETSMVVMLPASGEFEKFQRDLSAIRLAELLDALEEREGRISLPRFGCRSKLDLKPVLKELGMPLAFTEGKADFTGIARGEVGERLLLDDVRHQSYISVDEQGTEAAAATAVEVKLESAPANPFEMTVDRPFLFLIRERETGLVLFLGRVVDAASAQGEN